MSKNLQILQILIPAIKADVMFVYEDSMNFVLEMRDKGKVSMGEYLELVDAINRLNEDGHLRNCIIYKRAYEMLTLKETGYKSDNPNQEQRWKDNAR